MSDSNILLDIQDDLAVVTINDPGTLNSLTISMTVELTKVIRSLGTRARAVVLTGSGRAFCAGANLGGGKSEPSSAKELAHDPGLSIETVFNPMVNALRNLPIPLVTAVNGAAAGVGCSMAMLGDLIVAAESAYFLVAFSRVGLIPDGGTTFILPRLIGKARATEMMLLAEKVPARQAYEWGLANRCVPDADLMTTALDLARRLAKGPASLGLTRRLIWDSIDSSWDEQVHNESMAAGVAGKTEDVAEGMRAFMEKRPPVFRGR